MWFASDYIREENGKLPGGGHLGIFLGGYVPPNVYVGMCGTTNWLPVLKKKT